MHIHRSFFLLHLLFPIMLQGQGKLTATQGKLIRPELLFDRFDSRQNLPDDRIRALHQDRRGFLWIGTMNGLSRYDGYTFKKYVQHNPGNSLSGNWTNAICEDKQNTLWIGTKAGLNQFDPITERFSSFHNDSRNPHSLFCNQINTLLFDNQGKLWIGTPKGLTLFDPATRLFTRFTHYPFTLPIAKLIRSTGNFIWIATADGPVRYNVRTNQHTFHRLMVRPNPYGERFWTLLEDNRHLYIGTGGDGLIRLNYDTTKQAYTHFEPALKVADSTRSMLHVEVFDIRRTSAGDLWLGTDRGLARLEKPGTPQATIQFYHNNPVNNQSISNDRVYRLLIDRGNMLWCGTESGLNKLDLRRLPFQYYTFTSQMASDQVRSISSSNGIDVWMGMARSGLYRYNLKTGQTHSFQFQPESSFWNAHRSIWIDTTQNVWLGTLGGTLQLQAGPSTRYKTLLDGAAVFAFLRDSRSNVWIGTNRGLYRIMPDGTRQAFHLPPKLSGNASSEFVRSLYEDHTGAIWVGFEDRGLYRLDYTTSRMTVVTGDKMSGYLQGNTIYSLLESPQNVLWVGSESGLNRLTLPDGTGSSVPVQIQSYRETDGLPDQSVNGLLADQQGILWVGTLKGLARFDPRKEQFQVYLPTLKFTHSCVYKSDEHQLLFGVSDGFISFDPARVAPDTCRPTVVLSEFRVFNRDVAINEVVNGDTLLHRSIAATPAITLNYLNNGFSLGFTGLHFANPAQHRYAYQLQGYDPDWVLTNADHRLATYTNLDPGTYRFRVKASSNADVWNEYPAGVTITVLPPPWKTGWAMTLYGIMAIGLIWLLIRYSVNQSRQRQQLQFEQLEKEQLKNLHQLKLRFFTDVSHEFRTPLTLIVGPVEDLVASADIQGVARQKIQLVQHNCRRLMHLIDELMTFQKLEQGMVAIHPQFIDFSEFLRQIYHNFEVLAQTSGLNFQLYLPTEPVTVSVDAEKIEKVVNNLIANAIRFTPAGGSIHVTLAMVVPHESVDRWVRVTVADSGIGISPDELPHLFERYFQSDHNKGGTGLGLSLTKSLVELHRGHIWVESQLAMGTAFMIDLPAEPSLTQVEPLTLTVIASDNSRESMPSGQDLTRSIPSDDSQTDKPRILLVEDNPDMLAYLKLLFADDYRVMQAENGRVALESIREQEPDVIISDIMMPELGGIELCKVLKSDLATCHIPLILLTARSTIEHRMEGIGMGADDYMPKPFHPPLLKIRVEKFIEAQQRLVQRLQAGQVIIPKDITRNPLDEAFLQKVIDTVMANLSNEEFSVEVLGDHVNMSRSNLFRKLKAITGQTPLDFIYQLRLNQSLEMLLDRRYSISEITYKVGFKNPSSFTRSFRKQFGKSPSEYLHDRLAQHRH